VSSAAHAAERRPKSRPGAGRVRVARVRRRRRASAKRTRAPSPSSERVRVVLRVNTSVRAPHNRAQFSLGEDAAVVRLPKRARARAPRHFLLPPPRLAPLSCRSSSNNSALANE